MSDNATADSLAMRRALGRCNGGSDCNCSSHSASPLRSSVAGSPSRSRSPRNDEGNSGDSSDNIAASRTPHPRATAKPPSLMLSMSMIGVECMLSGLRSVSMVVTLQSRNAGGKNIGRRFMGCPLEEEGDQCQFEEWLDEPWPERVQESLKQLWKVLKVTRRCKARANDALYDALESSDIVTLARVVLQEEANRTKRVAQRICDTYERKVVVAMIDRSKMMYLIYCLLGVIIFPVLAIVFKAN